MSDRVNLMFVTLEIRTKLSKIRIKMEPKLKKIKF